MATCQFCLKIATQTYEPENIERISVDCKVCGQYIISRTALASDLVTEEKKYIVSAALRKAYENSSKQEVSNENIDEIINSIRIPKTPFDQIKSLVSYLAKKQPNFHVHVELDPDRDYPIVVGKDNGYLSYALRQAVVLGFVEQHSNVFRLTLEGWTYYEKIQKREINSKKAFVAMWFDHSMDDVWEYGFKRALEDDELGFEAIRIDKKEHNNKIDDEIIAEIRRSGILIADFTGHRGGVYFESGFAMGLGIPVIWTCREEDIKNAHLDTRQYSHITWNSPDDLFTKLRTRILATAPYPNQ